MSTVNNNGSKDDNDINVLCSSEDNTYGFSIGPLTDNIIKSILKELQKNKHKEQIINHIIDPIMIDVKTRYYPHMMSLMGILFFIIFLLLVIIAILIHNSKRINHDNHNKHTPC